MLQKMYKKLRSEKANTLLENVIILPLIIIVIYFMILASFVIHDHSTLDAAAKRGTIYAARCVSDPNYPMILQQSGHQSGMLDTNVTEFTADSFNGVGNNIKPYRYLVMNTADIKDATVNEVYNIIQQTKIPWREIETGDIVVKIDNKIIYQNVEVSITARYPLPQIFGNFGLPTEFNYIVSAVTAVNDPDEFIRNVDLIVDVCVAIDQKTGGNIQKVIAKLNDMGTRLTQFLSGEKGIGGPGGTGTNLAGGSGGGNENNYIAGAEETGDTDDDPETGEGGESGNAGEGNSAGGVEIAGNTTSGGLGFIYGDKEEEEKPQESSDASAEGATEKEEVTPQQLREIMIARFGQGTVDAISEGVDTSAWTEDDWEIYIHQYLLDGSLPGDWDVPIPVPKPSSTPNIENKVFDSGLTQSQIEEILNTPKGERQDPSTYLSQEYIEAHLAQFDEGASIIMTKEQYESYVSGKPMIGIPDDGTQFVLPKNYCDDIASKAAGDISYYEKALGFDPGHFADGGGLVRIDIDNLNGLNLRIPSGNEAGANNHWIPGGKTDGGVPEAVTDLIPNVSDNVTVSEIK